MINVITNNIKQKNSMNNIIQTIRHSARAAAVLLIALCAAQTAWAWDGQGTEANPYQITRASDLQQLAINVNNGTTYENVYFRQTAAINMAGETMTPIGNYDHPFMGHYDGNNKTISHLTITGSTLAALFGHANGISYGQTYHPSSLKNIVLTDCNIDVSSVTNSYAAGICAKNGSYNTVENCRVSGTIKGNYAAGGIVGQQNNGNVQNCFADVTVTASVQKLSYGNQSTYCSVGKIIGYVGSLGSNTVTGNYYHNDGATDGTNAAITAIGKGSSTTYPDAGRATPVYPVSAPSGLTVSGTPAATHDGTGYYAEGAVLTIGTGSADKVFSDFTATGATASSLAADRRSATVTVGTADVTVSATLQTVSGTTADGLTWSLAQDNSGNYTRLTVGGNGAMQNYSYTTVGDLWRTTAPWGYGLTSVTVGDGVTAIGSYAFIGSQSLAAATIGSSVATIGQQAFDHCDALVTVTLPASVTTLGQGAFYNCIGLQRIDILHDGAVSLAANVFHNDNALQYITFPSIAALQANTTGNWSAYAAKLRAKFGNQHFAVTTEGGTPAYAITTADDLRNLAAAVNATGNISTGKTFRQTADIDLASGGNFTPIAELGGSYCFAGTYDGGGHTISGLTVSKKYGNIGLFGVVSGATVRNVILLSPNVKATPTSNNSVSLGALIGSCDMASNRVENCHVVNPTVSSSSTHSWNYVGAIIGNIWDPNTTVTNCYYYGGNANAAYGNNPNGATVTRVCAAHRVTPADGVTIQTPMAADFGFTCDADNDGTAENYWRTGAQLTLGYTGTVPNGYTIGYTATNGSTISGSTLTMPDADVTVTATVSVIPWDGDGSKGKPFIIEYPSQLLLLAHRVNGTNGEEANDYSGKYFKLGADIAFSHDANEGDNYAENYEAIGGRVGGTHDFKGNFDGDGHTVSGIRINKTGSGNADDNQGLFGLIGIGAEIYDVHLTDARITGYDYVGGIVGYNFGTVSGCTVTDSYITYNAFDHGTICGKNTALLTNNYYHGCTVNGTAVTSGKGCQGADITDNNGAVSIHTLTLAEGITTATAATVTHAGTGYYAQGTAIALSYGGTIGDGYQLVIVSNDGNGSNAATADGNGSYTAVMPAADATAKVDFIDWAVAYEGSETDPYIIYNKDQLDLLAHRVNGTHGETLQTDGYSGKFFQLANDISYTHTSDWNAFTNDESNFEAIGGRYNNSNRYFCGHFDGNSKTISGIRIYKGSNGNADNYQGFFGRTDGADIHDLTLADARITGYDYTGGIVGYNNGTVTRCHVAADVAVCTVQSNALDHGGIAGYNNGGTIEQCTSAAKLTTADASQSGRYGGIAGYNSGTLRDNLAIAATVPAAKNNTYGAITGLNGRTLLRNYYAACKVNDTPNATGVGCGYISDGNGGYTTADVTYNDGAVCINTLALAANQAPDGNYWTTYYNGFLGFTIDENENACAYTATYGGDKLTLHKLGKEIPAGTAVIIVADNDVVSMTAATAIDDFSGTNDLRGVDYDTDVDDLGTGTFYVLGMTTVKNEQHFGFHRYTGEEMAAHKAFVHVDSSQSPARSLTMVFDEATGIESAEADSSLFTLHSSLSTWFTLDGRRLQAKPTAPGIYINNGRKVVIK